MDTPSIAFYFTVLCLMAISVVIFFILEHLYPHGLGLKKVNEKTRKLIAALFFIIPAASFLVWNFLGNPVGYQVSGLRWSPVTSGGNEFSVLFGTISYWILHVTIVFIGVFIFFRPELAKKIMVYVILPLCIFNIANFTQLLDVLRIANQSDWSLLPEAVSAVLLGMMVISLTCLSLYFAYDVVVRRKTATINGMVVEDTSKGFKLPKFYNWKEILIFSLVIIGILAIAVPPNVYYMFSGSITPIKLLNFRQGQRIQFILAIFVVLMVYFTLRKESPEMKRFALVFISFAGLLNYMSRGEFNPTFFDFFYGDFSSLTRWPFHLCDSAMFILPLLMAFKLKKVFYFTVFINVFGAIMALMMPDFGAIEQFFNPTVVSFWYCHCTAAFLPLLALAFKLYSKPKWKDFWYSVAWFCLYFVIVMFLNGWLSNYGSVDFFFLNSTHVIDQLGPGLLPLRNQFIWRFDVGDLAFTYYPVFQGLFFITYIGLALVMWFIYINFFSFASRLHIMEVKYRDLKIQKRKFIENGKGADLNSPYILGGETMIKLENFSKIYGKSKVFAVNNANISVPEGHIFGFLGPNGAGKSTIIKCLVGIQPLTSGHAYICGYDVTMQSKQAKLNIGFVPDHYALYENLTGFEYINYIADMYGVSKEDRAERMNDLVERFELVKAFNNQIRTYSHGMKQKIAIIAALIHAPKIWILDEPLTGLDPQSIFQVKETMKDYARKGNIVFFSSHIMDVVERLCDSFAIIKFGQIIKSGAMTEVVNSGKTLENYYMEAISDDSIVAIPVKKDETDNEREVAKTE